MAAIAAAAVAAAVPTKVAAAGVPGFAVGSVRAWPRRLPLVPVVSKKQNTTMNRCC